MGPFDSEKIKGTFKKDISTVRQNDVWSSATINNFVETVYNLFRMESAYRLTYKNSGQEIGERLLKENSVTDGTGVCKAFAMIPDLHFSVQPADGGNAGYIQITPAQRPAPDADDSAFTRESDGESRYRLFYGTGDVSHSVKPYSMFRYPRTSSGEGSVPGTGTAADDNYCIITYQCGADSTGYEGEASVTPKYSRMVEIVCIYDPGISESNSVITAERATDMPHTLPPVKFTFTFGKSVTVQNFADRLNGLVYGEETPARIFAARLAGDSGEANNATLLTALFEDGAGTTRQVRVLRFVPVRSCISFHQASEEGDTLDSVSLEKLTGRGGNLGTISLTEYDGTWETGAVFRHTGTYGFIIKNQISEAPSIEYASMLPLVYIPNKVNNEHYEPAMADPASTPVSLPAWYADMSSKNITMADTADFSSDYFFVPYITITDRTIEIAGFIIDIDTLLLYEELTAAVIPGSYMPKLEESKVLYDSYKNFSQTQESRNRLTTEADKVYREMQPAVNPEMVPFSGDNEDSGTTLGLGANKLLKGNGAVKAFALDRTLQMMLGLNWKLNDIIWIDPLLLDGGEDRQRHMYGSVAHAIEDDAKWGRGSLIRPTTVFIHITDADDDGPAYSNDPEDDTSYQSETSAPRRNMWREIYADYLPEGVRHIALRAVAKNPPVTVTQPEFELDFAYGKTNLYLRVIQHPALFSTADSNCWDYDETVHDSTGMKHLICHTDNYRSSPALPGFGDIDLNVNYHPLKGQDFSGVRHVCIDDIYAGRRVPSKIPNNKIRLSGIKANTLTYIPRAFYFNRSEYAAQGLTCFKSSPSNTWEEYGNYIKIPGTSAAETPAGQRLDWAGFNREVIIDQDCVITSVDMSIDVTAEGCTPDSLIIKGSCISYLNFNAGIPTIRLAHGSMDVSYPQEEELLSCRVTIPAAGQLMLWRNDSGSTCTADVTMLQVMNRKASHGGDNTVVFTPVAWPFGIPVTGQLVSSFVPAYAYAVTKSGDTFTLSSGWPNNRLVSLGIENEAYAPLEGGRLDLTLCFEDRTQAAFAAERSSSVDCETRDLSQIRSLIKLDRDLRNLDFVVRINDSGLKSDGWAILPDNPSGITYNAGDWQAFDPEIFLPRAPWWGSPDSATRFPKAFLFIDCGLMKSDTDLSSRFINCNIEIDLTNDHILMERSYYNTEYKAWRSAPLAQFMASRFFRRSPYVFYFGTGAPHLYGTSTILAGTALHWDVRQSENTSVSFVWDTRIYAAAVFPEIADEEGTEETYLPGSENQTLFTSRGTFIFMSGLKSGRVGIPSLYMPPAGVPRPKGNESDYGPAYRRGNVVALFECMTGCELNVGQLDTLYRLNNDTLVQGRTADEQIVYNEPEQGFVFFIYPRDFSSSGIDRQINCNNRLYVGRWHTRMLLAGIYGLYDSSVEIHYAFNDMVHSLSLDQSNISEIPRNINWGMKEMRPGVMREKQFAVGTKDPINCHFCYLPAAPLFYLAEVHSCNIKFVPAEKKGIYGVTLLGGTRQLDQNTSMRTAYYNISQGKDSEYNSYIANFRDVGDSRDSFRPIRLAVGWVLSVNVSPAVIGEYVSPSSNNTINCTVTRANLIAGAMNKVTGWCYRLHAVGSFDRVPEQYHYDNDRYPLDNPQFSDIYFPPWLPGADMPRVNSLTLRGSGPLSIHPWAMNVTTERAFDVCVPGLSRQYDSQSDEPGLLKKCALLFADATLDSIPLNPVSPFLNATAPEATLDYPHAVASVRNKDIFRLSTGLKPGYTIEDSSINLAEEHTFAGSVPADPTALHPLIGDTAIPENPASQMVNILFSSYLTGPKVNTLCLLNAANSVELSTLLVATSDIKYNPVLDTFQADSQDSYSASAPGPDTYGAYQIYAGALLHTVVVAGYALGAAESNEDPATEPNG